MYTALNASEYTVLTELTIREGYGYDLLRRLRARSIQVAPSSIYRALHRLLCLGYIHARTTPSHNAPPRTLYSISPQGKNRLTRRKSEVIDRVEELHALYRVKIESLRKLLD